MKNFKGCFRALLEFACNTWEILITFLMAGNYQDYVTSTLRKHNCPLEFSGLYIQQVF